MSSTPTTYGANPHRLPVLGVVAVLLFSVMGGSAGAADQTASPNPLLPAPIALQTLWPDFSLVQKYPAMAPPGMKPLYSAADWHWYQKKYGDQARRVGYELLSRRIAFAKDMLQQAQIETHPGRVRLLCLRVFALCYQSRSGSPLAQAALRRYMQVAHLASIVQIAPIWRMTNLLAYLAATPLAERHRYDILAEQANVQLTLELLWAGQGNAAYRVVRRLGVHETLTVRADHKLMFEMSVARTIVGQTIRMMHDLRNQYRLMLAGQEPAAMTVYLYATVVDPNPQLRSWILSRWLHSPVGELDRLMVKCRHNSDACYAVARTLQAQAQRQPAGILRNRVLFAALENYRRYLKLPLTRKNRIPRALALIAVQQVIGQGARPNPQIAPLAGLVGPPPTTAAVSTRP